MAPKRKQKNVAKSAPSYVVGKFISDEAERLYRVMKIRKLIAERGIAVDELSEFIAQRQWGKLVQEPKSAVIVDTPFCPGNFFFLNQLGSFSTE